MSQSRTSRKTVEVAYLLERANYFLKHSEDDQVGERRGVCSMIELALHKANAYNGYLHLDSAGVNYDEIKAGQPFSAVDESRRRYL